MTSSQRDMDWEMAERFRLGEEKAFDFFFRKLYPSLCFFANGIVKDRFIAEDIASFSFVKIWAKHHQFDEARNIKYYLYQIVRNDCLTHLKLQTRDLQKEEEITYLNGSGFTPDIESQIISAEFLRELYQAFSDLSAQCSLVFTMLYRDGKTVKEIAKELGLSESTVRTQKARGLQFLRKKFL